MKKGEEQRQFLTIDEFYHGVQSKVMEMDKEHNLRYITSRSTEDIALHIYLLCESIKNYCRTTAIPNEGILLEKTDLCVKTLKYLFCNTNFTCQSLLSEDVASGHLVDIQPPFSPYLLIEILWHLNFEEFLVESFLHFPLDLCVEVLEVLPRCIDLLDFERSSKFLTTLVSNVYKKLIILNDTGDQTKDINGSARRLSGNLQELLLQFSNERFLRMDTIKTLNDKYKRYGILLKSIIQMVRTCLTTKSKVKIPCEMAKMYRLTFGRDPFEKTDETVFKELLTEINRELISLLLKKVKEIDCNIYLNWMEYDDKENTSQTLQRAIGLESYFFIQNTQEYKNSNIQEYSHLVECLQQISSEPDPENNLESLQMVDLCQGVREGRLECLMTLFRRYKEWDDSVVDTINSNISLLKISNCEELFEYLTGELTHPGNNTENLQFYSLCLAKALVYLKITELYEITVKFIMKFSDKDNLENVIDITNFERFIMLNPNFSSAKNLRVVLFFLCIKTRITLKILLKMAIGHSDYPDVAITLDDLMLLLPVLKIQTYSKYQTMIQTLKSKCSEKRESLLVSNTLLSGQSGIISGSKLLEKMEPRKPLSVTLAVSILQDICLEGSDWNANKFSGLLECLYTFNSVSVVVNEIFIPFLLSKSCSYVYLKYILIELHKLEGKFKCREISPDLILALQYQGLKVLSYNISRFIIDELLTMMYSLTRHLFLNEIDIKAIDEFDDPICNLFFRQPCIRLFMSIYNSLHQVKIIRVLTSYPTNLPNDIIFRHFMLHSTMEQYLNYARQSYELKIRGLGYNKIEAMENFVRWTLETCLLCLEYPDVTAPDSIGFLLRCLLKLLSTVHYRANSKNYKRLCTSLESNLMIFKDTIVYTALEDAYSSMLEQCKGLFLNLELVINALEQFSLACIQESYKLRIYDAPHSPLAVKFWLGNEIVTALFEENLKDEEYLKKLTNSLESEKKMSEDDFGKFLLSLLNISLVL